ncbi:SAV_915 family protein [Streptomyces sp. NPDC004134]|uniref:SAV_915 family protein n=1 Tax=Streptomyces sp. NPDC004134 TaxID=3364691 RepID=UPI00369378C8
MSEPRADEDPDPAEPAPGARAVLYVPVCPVPYGCTTRFFRTPLGERTAVAFTSRAKLAAALGAGQPGIRLSAGALRALAAPLGVTRLTVDPRLVAPAPSRTPARARSTSPTSASAFVPAADALAG